MLQTALPSSDDFTGSWTPTPVYSSIKIPAPPDLQFVTSAPNPSPDSFQVRLSPLARPVMGAQQVQVRLRCTTTESTEVTIELRQGNILIAGWTVEPSSSFQTYSFTLTAFEVGKISDYKNLRLRVTAELLGSSRSSRGSGGLKFCCDGSTAATLHATITNGGIFNGTYVLTAGGAPHLWSDFSFPSGTCPGNSFVFQCMPDGLTWYLIISNPPLNYFTTTVNCDPFEVVFSGIDLSSCGGGNNATVTVTL